jgi:hypothetical protein
MASERILTEFDSRPTTSFMMMSRLFDITESLAVLVLRVLTIIKKQIRFFAILEKRAENAVESYYRLLPGIILIFVTSTKRKCTGHTHAESW